jgi:hypothetical protein
MDPFIIINDMASEIASGFSLPALVSALILFHQISVEPVRSSSF